MHMQGDRKLHEDVSFALGLLLPRQIYIKHSLGQNRDIGVQKSNMDSQELRGKCNVALLQSLSDAVSGQAATATFACGGSVPIVEPAVTRDAVVTEPKPSCLPVALRWDAPTFPTGSKIVFPLQFEKEASQLMLNALEKVCQPATFGLAGNDVLDENYRRAIKLDASTFPTNFHPHDCGIIESIQQILLPSTIGGGQLIGIGPKGVRVELYNLNVCCIAD